jgi:hypothetical protein
MLSLAHPDAILFLVEANESEHSCVQMYSRSSEDGRMLSKAYPSSDGSHWVSTANAALHVSLSVSTLVESPVYEMPSRTLFARARATRNKAGHVRIRCNISAGDSECWSVAQKWKGDGKDACIATHLCKSAVGDKIPDEASRGPRIYLPTVVTACMSQRFTNEDVWRQFLPSPYL